jgi:hypothetical protein
MGIIGKDFKYKTVKGFLTKDEIDILNIYCEIKHRTNQCNFDRSPQSDNFDTYFYGDPLMESIMLKKLSLMEKETGKKLLPTYSFWRMYTKFANLKKHKDRPSCEISVTVNIGSDGTKWPIFMEGTSIDLNEGDAIIYLGRELTHWREEFQGDWCAQTFLHYVDKEGENKNQFRDGRPYWGVEK